MICNHEVHASNEKPFENNPRCKIKKHVFSRRYMNLIDLKWYPS